MRKFNIKFEEHIIGEDKKAIFKNNSVISEILSLLFRKKQPTLI